MVSSNYLYTLKITGNLPQHIKVAGFHDIISRYAIVGSVIEVSIKIENKYQVESNDYILPMIFKDRMDTDYYQNLVFREDGKFYIEPPQVVLNL